MPGTNDALRVIFDQMADALRILGEDSFRASAHARVARELKGLAEDVRTIVDRDREHAAARLAELPGIGKSSARRILEFLDKGSIKEHRELLEKVPAGLFDVLAVPGVGPKAVHAMWQELGITSLAELKERLDSEELAELPRMGQKTIDNIRQAIAFSEKAKDRVPLGVAKPIADRLVAALRDTAGARQVEYAGSLRRGRETIGDLDLLAAVPQKGDVAAALRERFVSLPEVVQVLARGETKSSVRLEVDGVALQADLRTVPEAVFGAALLYFTGSKDHNVRLREISIKQDKHLNEYGLFAGTEERPQDRGETPLAAAMEAEIYAALGLPWIPPELREDRGELSGVPEDLVEIGHIRAELHSHTNASDGRLPLAEMAAEAKRRGFHTLAVTDHSQSSAIAGGLEPDRLRRHIDAIRECNEKTKGIQLLAGSEVDVLPDGSLDYDDDLLALLDIVVASPHASLRQSPKDATARLVRAVRHPLVHILGHPTGRMIGRREGLRADMDQVFAAAAECDTVLEINANWRRLDLRDQHVRAALAHGCKIAIDTDAHSVRDFGHLVYGVLTARRGGLERDRCINTWTAKRLRTWLESKRS